MGGRRFFAGMSRDRSGKRGPPPSSPQVGGSSPGWTGGTSSRVASRSRRSSSVSTTAGSGEGGISVTQNRYRFIVTTLLKTDRRPTSALRPFGRRITIEERRDVITAYGSRNGRFGTHGGKHGPPASAPRPWLRRL